MMICLAICLARVYLWHRGESSKQCCKSQVCKLVTNSKETQNKSENEDKFAIVYPFATVRLRYEYHPH